MTGSPQMIWYGDLSGFEVGPDGESVLVVTHRCGWQQDFFNTTEYLANVVAVALAHVGNCDKEGYVGKHRKKDDNG